MSTQNYIAISANISGTVGRGCAVQVTGQNGVRPTVAAATAKTIAADEQVIGISLDDYTDGQSGTIVIAGLCQVRVSGAVTMSTTPFLGPNAATGRLGPCTTGGATDYTIATALTNATANGDFIPAIVRQRGVA